MKLELKHLAPYLPYELRILYHGDSRKMNAGNGSSGHWIGITATIQRQGENCKPILRPLSDLTKEIEVNGERFVPIEKLYKEYNCEADYEFLEAISNDLASADDLVQVAPYDIIIRLFEWHFDVFNLHEANLCIYYDELNK